MAEPARVANARELQELEPYPVARGLGDDAALTDRLLSPLWTRSRVWWILFAISGLLALLFVVSATYTIAVGIGAWGNNIPVAWAFAITDFVWWIGIGHAGTFISAFLILLGQRWRASVNRLAEAMTSDATPVRAAIWSSVSPGWSRYR